MLFKQPHTNTKVLGTVVWWQDGFTDTKRVNRNRNWKKDIQHNGQNERDKRINNDVQNTTQKTKDRVTQTQQRNWGWTGVNCSSYIAVVLTQ